MHHDARSSKPQKVGLEVGQNSGLPKKYYTFQILTSLTHETAGATGTRHSPRPLSGGSSCATRAHRAAGMWWCVLSCLKIERSVIRQLLPLHRRVTPAANPPYGAAACAMAHQAGTTMWLRRASYSGPTVAALFRRCFEVFERLPVPVTCW
jgi:hypothetical protein